jgi:hypothetical protein
MRRRLRPLPRLAGAVALAAWSAVLVGQSVQLPRFFDDDPIWIEPDPEDASKTVETDLSFAADIADNLFGEPGDDRAGVRALDLNSVDEVLDSSWFTNRIGRQPLTVDDVLRANSTGGPAEGTWTIVSAKTDGRTPGFVIKDKTNTTWFLKFDVPGHSGMATGSEVLVTRLMWALGYNVPEYDIAYLNVDRLALSPNARIEPRSFHERPMKPLDIRKLLARAEREADGTFRLSASRQLPGEPVGPFRFYGTRPDDPNDVVPHEHRRSLRALRVFSAWVNHVELRSGNTLDTKVPEDGRVVLRHHLLDFGSTLGSAGIKMRPWWEGHAYMYEPGQSWRSALSLGFWLPEWRRIPYYENDAIGRMPALEHPFDPDAWKPGIPNAAFLRLRDDDAFWAARRVMAFTDAMIEGAVKVARFKDPEAERFVIAALKARRDAIGRTYLARVNPVVDPALDAGGRLTFGNAAVAAGFAAAPAEYVAEWAHFDNATWKTEPIGTTSGAPGMTAPAGLPTAPGAFVRVSIAARGGGAPASWAVPVHAYFRRLPDATWRLVGFERLG